MIGSLQLLCGLAVIIGLCQCFEPRHPEGGIKGWWYNVQNAFLTLIIPGAAGFGLLWLIFGISTPD